MPEIHTLDINEIEESAESLLNTEWCPKQTQNKWINSLSWDIYDAGQDDWIKVDKPGSPGMYTPPDWENLPHIDALHHKPGEAGMDLRPHVYDAVLKQYILIDSGGQVSAFPPEPGDVPDPKLRLKAANGTRIQCYGFKDIEIRIGRKTYPFQIIKADVESPILGWDFVRRHKLDLVWNDNEEITIQDSKAKISSVLKFKPMPIQKSLAMKNLSFIGEHTQAPRGAVGADAERLIAEVAAILALDEDEASDSEDINILADSPYKQLLAKFPELLKQNFMTECTKSDIIHRINTNNESPCRAKLRRLLPGSPKAIKAKEAWDELIKLGIVEKVDPSKSNSWVSPIHFVPKPCGALRPVGDFRALNIKTELDLFPLPHLRDFTHKIAGCSVFSKVDLRKAFHQIIIDERDRAKTTVTTPWGLFQFKRLAMGMKNSAQAFQRMVQDVIGDMSNVFVYLDDLLIFTRTPQEHLETLEVLFSKLEQAGLTLALSKCEFGVDALEYLGYRVDSTGITPVKRKVDALQNFPSPAKQKDLLAFLGALNYYRASLPKLKSSESVDKEMPDRSPAQVLDPLYKLATCNIKRTKGNYFTDIWKAHTNLQDAFQDAKTLLQKAITLEYPVPSAPLALCTDASKTHLGASLEQFVGGSWRCLGLWSKSLRPEQQRYSTYIRELLAIKHSLRHFIHEINGRVLTVYTDHLPILGSWKNPDLQAHDNIAMNAINEIAQWTSDIRHRAGKDLLVPDLMSRPFNPSQLGSAHLSKPESKSDPDYIAPEATMSALEQVALNVVSPQAIAESQSSCPEVSRHRAGLKPAGVKMEDVDNFGVSLYCEVSDVNNPRPLLPEAQRCLVLNLLHHQDHPSAKETVRRVSKEYYWPQLRKQVESFVRTCHPCQLAKQSPTVKAGVGVFPVPDQRFSAIHLDVVGPLPVSEGQRFLLTILDRTSRWLEAYPMASATSAECSKAFMQWASRYGLPHVAISDNGNSFISNIYKDIMKTFNVQVRFTPAYHAASNGAIEKRHQTIKNSLKASLVDLGNTEGNKWMSALPWVLLGKRIQVQPDLDVSAAQLVFGKSLSIPGQILGHPGPPLTNLQTKTLLEGLYKLSAKPAIQTSTVPNPVDLTWTLKVKSVYVQMDGPHGLAPRWEGPYPIVSRPSRSQITVRIGSYVNGTPRLQTYNWNSVKVANEREGAQMGSRPKLGRKPKNATSSVADPNSTELETPTVSTPVDAQNENNQSGAKIQTPSNSSSNRRNGSPSLSQGDSSGNNPLYSPVVDPSGSQQAMQPDAPGRPVRSTRNPSPRYVHSMASVTTLPEAPILTFLSIPPIKTWSASPEELKFINDSIGG